MKGRLAAAMLMVAGMTLALAAGARAGEQPAGLEQSIENHPIDEGGAATGDATGKAPAVSPGGGGFDAGRVALALAGVVGLILVMRAGSKRFFPGGAAHRSTGAVKVLSRCTISPRQHVLLIQVGKRLLIVGDSGAQLNALCEISDSVEVDSLMGQIREEAAASGRRFETLFGRARKGFGEKPGEMGEGDVQGRRELGGMESSAGGEERFDATHEVNDPSMAATEKELAGLSEKVRVLARQLGGA